MESIIQKLAVLSEFFSFLWQQKLWWLIPMILIFGIVGLLVIFVGSSPLAPIIYPLF